MKTKKLLLLLMAALLSACTMPKAPATPTPTEVIVPTETPTPEPTPTIPPSVALVNGQYITTEDLETKISQLRDAAQSLGETVPEDAALREEALNALTEETLFLNAAREKGIAPTEEELDSRIQSLCDDMGGCDALRAWESANHYSEEGFRRSLERELSASKMRESIFAERLPQMEQLHLYRIQSYTKSDLTDALTKLEMGIAFPEVAADMDSISGGDLDWVTRGVLLSQELEDKLFSMNAGEYTDILEMDGTFNLFYVAEKQSGREMTMQVKQIAQRRALADWLAEQKAAAVIETL